jgi:hypothetical protein
MTSTTAKQNNGNGNGNGRNGRNGNGNGDKRLGSWVLRTLGNAAFPLCLVSLTAIVTVIKTNGEQDARIRRQEERPHISQSDVILQERRLSIIEGRLSLIEQTRFTERDGADLDKRILLLEEKCRNVQKKLDACMEK